MASDDTDLLRKAKKLESKELANIKFTPASVSAFDKLLWDAYSTRCPNPVDYFNRRDLVRIFNVIAKEIYGNSNSSPVVEGYGSFVMDIFNDASDLDLSINFNNNSSEIPRQKKIETLRKFAKKLHAIQRKGHVRGVQTIMTARVPIIKVTDCGTGIECDLSVDNRDGIVKSHIIYAISAIDERFQKLSFLMKSWAKAHNINSSKDRTLNSLSIVSLVAFHLQTRNPPILPPFSALLNGGADPAAVMKVVSSYLNYGKNNRESLAELFITLFVKLASVQKLWQKGICASLYEGSWISKSWGSHSYSLSVEDFTDQSQNVARAVGTEEVKKIYGCIRESLNYFSDFLNGQMLGTKLVDLLFGRHTVSTLGRGGTGHIDEIKKTGDIDETKEAGLIDETKKTGHIDETKKTGHIDETKKTGHIDEAKKTKHIDETKKNLPSLQNQRPPKRMRLMGSFEKKQVQKPSETNCPVQSWQRAQPWKGSVQGHRLDVVPWGGTFQPPAISSSDNKVHHGFGPGAVPVIPWGGTFQPPAISSSDNKVHHGFGPGAVPVIPWGGTFQPPAISSSDNKVHHGYGPGAVPSAFALNPLGFEGSYNPSLQSHLVSLQNSMGFIGPFHQKAVDPNPYLGPIHSLLTQVSHNLQQGGPYYSNARK